MDANPRLLFASRVITGHHQAHGTRGRGLRYMKKSPRMIGSGMSSPNVKAAALFALAAIWLTGFSTEEALAGYPDRIVRIVVPFAPGGGTDVVARTLAQEMARDLGVSVIIENKPGAGTIIGTQAVAASEPDGYTLLMGTFANAVNPSLYAKLPYDPRQDLTPISLVARSFNIVVVNPASHITSVAELIAVAKA